jgi:hypothetical protein
MINFSTTEVEFFKLAQALNGMGAIIKELTPQISGQFDRANFKKDFLILAYIGRCGVKDRLDHFKWSIENELLVPSLDSEPILLGLALVLTVDRLEVIANILGMEFELGEFMRKGPMFYEFERILPPELINDF